MLNKSIMTVETNSRIRALIDKQILTFGVIKTHVVFLPFNESNVVCMHL